MLQIPTLDSDDLTAFKRDGYLVKRGAFSPEDMQTITTWTEELVAMPEVSGRHWVYHEKSQKDGADLISRIEKIAPFHAGFAELTEALKAPMAQLLGEPAVLFKEKVNFKMPGGDGFKPHQDSQAGWYNYADMFISALVSIDRSTLENGCLQMAGGHHKQGLKMAWEPLSESEMEGMEFVPVPTEPGDVIFFDSYAPHSSEPNLSDDIRRIYYATYNGASKGDHMIQYYADKYANYPPDIDRQKDKEYVFRV
ncbi:phytanoyl-CoA dioxygenase family protein [Pseudooceanicola sp.]|uniref:phytanoyl-CoA dioxygenase family protein n=1 Tax=Pseudooceanicola sp. TaxID=1914328 RepID=UPI00260D8AEE|nr:phytanoyl-CoA dioxygenase family protein [Pseudooceanicola sp.]MDF1855363.1 phytanoyl-CoA dioxygenase family protein [Pseudooceanicola sp.]